MSEVTNKFQLVTDGDSASRTFGKLKVRVRYVDQVTDEQAFGEKSKYGTMYHNRYRVTLTNTESKARCSFNFHDSHKNTTEEDIFPKDLGYSILCCVKMDWNYTKENYPTFEDFANEFGYDTDSRKAEKLYKTCIKQGEKLQAVVDEELLEKLPD